VTATTAAGSELESKEPNRTKPDGSAVFALLRGLSILDAFTSDRTELGVNEIARIVGMHKSTVSRLCATLENAGYLERDPATNRFHLGARIFQLAGSETPTRDLRLVARPVMLELVEATRETATLGKREELDIVTIDVVDGLNFVRMATRVGMRTQVHASAVAKAILAYTDEDEVDQIIGTGPMPKLTPNTITDPAVLKERLADVRAQGYSVDMEEMEIGLRCVGAPIYDHRGMVSAGISVSGPRHHMTEDVMRRCGPLVRKAADKISARLGATPSVGGDQVSPD